MQWCASAAKNNPSVSRHELESCNRVKNPNVVPNSSQKGTSR